METGHLPFGFKSLSWRLGAWILGTVGLLYLATLFYSNWLSRQVMLAGAQRAALELTRAEVSEIRRVLGTVEESTELLATVVGLVEMSESELRDALRAFVISDERIYGSTAAFAPFGFAESQEHFAPYYFSNDNRDVSVADLSADDYAYWTQDWYRDAAESGSPAWSEPYVDEGGGETWMVTFAVPFFHAADGARTVRGVATADVSLDWLHEQVRNIRVGETGYGVILSERGHVISHPDPEWMRRAETALQIDVEERAPEVPAIVARMLRGESGFEPFTDRYLGKRTRLTFAPIHHAGWSLAVIYPEDELFSGLRRNLMRQLALSVVGLTVLVAVVVSLARRLTEPIQALAVGAGEIARGDLETELPVPDSSDEVGALTLSFQEMRTSLKQHIEDLKVATAAKQKLESELEIARNIQMDMLPASELGGSSEGFELSATLVPARHVGGDLYFHALADGRVAFLVGDVSGKGVPAALFMARTKTLFETEALRAHSVSAALSLVNDRLMADNDTGMFVTVFAGVLDPATGELVCASGGHDPPILVPADGSKPRPLAIEGGPLIGLLPTAECPDHRLSLAAGDAIVVSTDGVSEARAANGNFFTEERLVETLEGQSGQEASAITQRVMSAVQHFAEGAEPSDDITIMTLRFLGSPTGR